MSNPSEVTTLKRSHAATFSTAGAPGWNAMAGARSIVNGQNHKLRAKP